MPIKLIQVQRKLNVGINTVVEFLRKKGFEVENSNPNTRISDEQYALLVKEFGKDLPEAGQKKESVKEISSSKEDKDSEIKTVIPEELKLKIVTKGKIDLDKPQKKAQEQSISKEKDIVMEEPVKKQEESDVKVIPEVKEPEVKQQPKEINEKRK